MQGYAVATSVARRRSGAFIASLLMLVGCSRDVDDSAQRADAAGNAAARAGAVVADESAGNQLSPQFPSIPQIVVPDIPRDR